MPQSDFKNFNLDAKEKLDWDEHGIGGFIAHTSKGSYRITGRKLYFLGKGRTGEQYVGDFKDARKAARKHFNEEI